MLRRSLVAVVVAVAVTLNLGVVAAMATPSQQRYLVYPSVWNWAFQTHVVNGQVVPVDHSWATFQAGVDEAKAVGFNAVKVHIPWSLVVSRSNITDYTLVDQQVDYVVNTLHLPAAILIDLTRYSSDGGDSVLPASDVMQDANGNYSIRTDLGGMNEISFASSDAITKANAFIQAVTSRYNSRYAAGSMLNYQVTMSQYAEAEYFIDPNLAILDYSAAAISSFRTWLPSKYATIAALNADWGSNFASFGQVTAPLNFNGASGLTWFQFRHYELKSVLDSFGNTIHGVASGLKNLVQFGSTFDAYVANRATASFPDLTTTADIVVNDDTPYFNHGFSMDVLRASLPGKWIGNECSWPALVPTQDQNAVYYNQVAQSFDHGATVVSFGNWTASDLSNHQSMFAQIVTNYLSTPVPAISTQNAIHMSAYDEYLNGNAAYQSTYNTLSNNGQSPVDVVLDDNLSLQPKGSITVDDNNPAIAYTGTWIYDPNRASVGDYGGNEHYTSIAGDSFQFVFNGSGISWIAEKNVTGGNTDIYIDGVLQATVNSYNATRLVQQTLYSNTQLTPSSHTFKAVKVSGSYLEVDRLQVSSLMVNDNDPGAIQYFGSWVHDSNRSGIGDYMGDEHYSAVQGDSFTVSFSGTGISWIAEKSPSGGTTSIYVDGVSTPTATVTSNTSVRNVEQTIYSINGLAPGLHSLSGVKNSGSYLEVDAFKLAP